MNIFDPEMIRVYAEDYFVWFALFVFIFSFSFTYFLIPKIIWVVKRKRLVEEVNNRSSHSGNIASFGGVAFYTTFIMVLAGLQAIDLRSASAQLIAAVTVLFILGLRDDLVATSPKTKFAGQLVATFLIVFSPELEITNLFGFLGIGEIPLVVGYLFASFLVLALINSYNLVDGINGLAGIIGIVVAGAYALVFYSFHQFFYFFVCLVLIGILLAFLRFNLAGPTRRIFMGDSGSLIIGLILGFLTLRIIAMDPIEANGNIFLNNRVFLVIGILFILMFDTSRVMMYRKFRKKSMFFPDQNHCHHILLKNNMSHSQASLTLGTANVFIIGLMILLISVLGQSLIALHLAVLVIYLLCWFVIQKLKRRGEGVKIEGALHRRIRIF